MRWRIRPFGTEPNAISVDSGVDGIVEDVVAVPLGEPDAW